MLARYDPVVEFAVLDCCLCAERTEQAVAHLHVATCVVGDRPLQAAVSPVELFCCEHHLRHTRGGAGRRRSGSNRTATGGGGTLRLPLLLIGTRSPSLLLLLLHPLTLPRWSTQVMLWSVLLLHLLPRLLRLLLRCVFLLLLLLLLPHQVLDHGGQGAVQ